METRAMDGLGEWARAAAIGTGLLAAVAHAGGSDSLPTPAQLKRLSLEELMDVKVTLASRQAEELSRSASSMQVITREEIRRAGIFTLPEALRLASNLQVARIDSRDWAITARGQNAYTADKLLVMIDGRSVYTPLYAGVFWDVQDLPVDNIDHIEVISGPAGALWGANAVNGVINIVTRPAEEMHGGYATAAAGSFLRDLETVRAGGQPAKDVHFYAWSRRFRYYPSEFPGGGEAGDRWGLSESGFRTDWVPDARRRLTVSGSLYQGRASQSPPAQGIPQAASPGQIDLDGQNLEARWSCGNDGSSGIEVLAYFDRTSRLIPSDFEEELATGDVEFQHRFAFWGRNAFTWGAGYRLSHDQVANSAVLRFLPARRDLHDVNLFAQDQIEVWPDRVRLTLGTRLQRTAYAGFEAMPSARAAWTPDARNTVWAAVSRAVRAPSRIDKDVYVPAQPPPAFPLAIAGGPDMGPEHLTAYEAGWRTHLAAALSASFSSFYNRYTDLRILERASDTAAAIANGADQDIYGLEADVGWQTMRWWQWRAGATWLGKSFRYRSGTAPFDVPGIGGEDPEAQYSLRSSVDLAWGLSASAWIRYVSRLGHPSVPYYATASAAVGWACRNLEVTLSGQDLAERRHREFQDGSQPVREIPRSVAARIGAHF